MEIKKDQMYIVRCDRAGVFFGKIKSRDGDNVTMTDVSKIWYWNGACAVEQLAVDGTINPTECSLTVVVPEMEVMAAVQIIPCSDKSVRSLSEVKKWKC